jgi:hypothetical protein
MGIERIALDHRIYLSDRPLHSLLQSYKERNTRFGVFLMHKKILVMGANPLPLLGLMGGISGISGISIGSILDQVIGTPKAPTKTFSHPKLSGRRLERLRKQCERR